MKANQVQSAVMSPTGSLAARATLGAELAGVAGGVAALALAAQVKVPVPGTVVPMTLQALAVLLIGLLMAPRAAIAAVVAYVACGSVGMPVFAAGSTGLAGPTGGYLVGFIVAAGVVSLLRRAVGQGWVGCLAASLAGMVVVFLCGVGWLAAWIRLGVGDAAPGTPLAMGFLPFAGKALVECLLAATIAERWVNRRQSPGSNAG